VIAPADFRYKSDCGILNPLKRAIESLLGDFYQFPAERVFSIAGLVVQAKRSSPQGADVVFVHNNVIIIIIIMLIYSSMMMVIEYTTDLSATKL